MSFDALQTKFNLRVLFLTSLSLINAIPRNWRIQIKNYKRLEQLSNTNVDLIKQTKTVNKTFYALFLKLKSELPEME